MTVDQVIQHFGGVAEAARAIGITYQAVQQWVDKGQVPEVRQWHIQAITDGALQVSQPKTA